MKPKKPKPPVEPYDPSKPLYDSWGKKFDASIHAMSKGQPVQDREGRFKYNRKAKKKFIADLDQQDLGL